MDELRDELKNPQDATLQRLIDEWFRYEFMQGWTKMGTVCYIAAHNYYVYLMIKGRKG